MDHKSPTSFSPQAPVSFSPEPNSKPPTPNNKHSGKNKKTGLIVTIVVAAALLVAGGVTVLILMLGNTENNDNNGDATTQQEVPEAVRIENSRTASSVTELDTICDVGAITNAAEFKKPYKIAAFYQTKSDRTWEPITIEADYSSSNPEETNVIACLSESEGTASKSATCQYRSGGQGVDVEYYSLEYELSVHEAQSGKRIENLGKIKGTASDNCPTAVTFSPSNPKIYAEPDVAELNTALSRFAEN